MRTGKRHSYAKFDHWRKYQPFLPARLRLTPDREPTEDWWPWRGAEIHLDRYPAPTSPLVVILVHGGGGNGRLLAPFGLMLREHGFESVLPDLPGYGLSVTPSRLFHHQGWVDCVADLVSTEAKRSNKPVVLLGMSLGGYLAYLAAAQGRNAAGVIATTLADPRLPVVRNQFARYPRLNRLITFLFPLAVAVLGSLRLPIRFFGNMEGIANDPKLAQVVSEDPNGGGNWVPLRFLYSVLEARPAIEPEDFDLCPVLLAHPAADRWTTIEASRPFFDKIKGPKELVMLENCGHWPIEEPGITQLEQSIVAFLQKLIPAKSILQAEMEKPPVVQPTS